MRACPCASQHCGPTWPMWNACLMCRTTAPGFPSSSRTCGSAGAIAFGHGSRTLTTGCPCPSPPTMPFGNLGPQLPGATPFIKLPLALWLTSEQRSLQAKSIHMGPRISAVIERILAEENGFDRRLEIFPEEVALHYRHAVRQEDRPGRRLSVGYRGARQALDRSDGLLPITMATLLTASPLDARPLVTELIERAAGRATPETVGAYFRQYARAVTRPVVAIYLLYGIGLE